MWFSVVCTLIYNDTRHHSSQNFVAFVGSRAIASQGSTARQFGHIRFVNSTSSLKRQCPGASRLEVAFSHPPLSCLF